MPVSLQFDGRQENIRGKGEKRRKTYESISVEDNDQKFSSADMTMTIRIMSWRKRRRH